MIMLARCQLKEKSGIYQAKKESMIDKPGQVVTIPHNFKQADQIFQAK